MPLTRPAIALAAVAGIGVAWAISSQVLLWTAIALALGAGAFADRRTQR
jgi:hypothetical protein